MSVDSSTHKPIVGPCRKDHAPRVFCAVDINAIAPSARKIIASMKASDASRGCGSYLYVEQNGNAYIVREDSSVALDWVKSHFSWLVGFYTRFGNENKGLAQTLDGIIEDLREHLGFSATDTRISVGLQRTGEANSPQSAPCLASLKRSKPVDAGDDDNSRHGGGQL